MEGDKLKIDSRRPSGIFYIEANRAYFYEEGLGSPLSLELGPEIISDLEVISKKKLESAIQTFVNGNKIAPKSIIILLSTTVTFDNEFPQSQPQADKSVEDFLELVPFENTISKQVKFPRKIRVVAANRELCETIKNSFVILGFFVAGIFPLSFYLEAVPSLQTNLDLGLIINKSPELKAYNLMPDIELSGSSPKKEKKDNKRLYILIGVFAILMVVFLFVIYRFIILPPKPQKTLPVRVPAPQPTVANSQVLPSPSEAPSPEEISSTPSANIQNPEAI